MNCGPPTSPNTALFDVFFVGVIKDGFSNRIVGCLIHPRMKYSITVNALDGAVARRGDLAC